MKPDSPTPFDAPSKRGALALLLVIGVVYGFLLWMARLEPLTGDGLFMLRFEKDQGHDLSALLDRLRFYHEHRNPRLGQLFTFLTYIPGPLHAIMTPLAILLMFVLVFVHATGRFPRTTVRDAALLLSATAFCWLATPVPGQAYFYRPITTNYIYSFALVLLYFLPFRLQHVSRQTWATVSLALVMLVAGLPVGKLNEHTGPVVIAVAGVYTLAALRRREWRNAVWMSSSTLGLLAGYLYLFFAPGLRKRVGAQRQEGVLETVVDRGGDNALLLGNLVWYLAPLLVLVGAVLGIAAWRRAAGPLAQPVARRRWLTAGAYAMAALLVLGISLAAPRSHERLAIAPALLCVIALLGVCELLSHDRVVLIALGIASLAVHLGFSYVLLDLYTDLHHDDTRRQTYLARSKPSDVVYVPVFRHRDKTPLFYGDSLDEMEIYRRNLASWHDVAELRIGAFRRTPASKEKLDAIALAKDLRSKDRDVRRAAKAKIKAKKPKAR